MRNRWTTYAIGGGLLASAACSGADPGSVTETKGSSVQALAGANIVGPDSPVARAGKVLFDNAFAHTNGRSCLSCHVDDKHFVLLPSDVQSRLAANPNDPLFNPIDADDPTAASPTYEHLKLGLIRIVLKLPDNMDLINADGSQVVTPAD